jgi:hypothetical protein
MTVLEQNSNPYTASPILGLLYGLTFCASACLPRVISYIAGIGGVNFVVMRLGVLINSLSVTT